MPLVVQACRSLGVPASVRQHVQIKQRERGYDEATMVESFVVLNAVGGDRVDDFQHLRDDAGLKEMLGHEVPSPDAARQFLNQFHSEEKLEQARDGRKPEQIAFIPEEADALAGLGEVNRELVRELGRRCPEQCIATVDQDATIIESHKQQALRTYEGERGYQPMLAVWAEMDAVLADEFRDGAYSVFWCTSSPAQRAYTTCMALPPGLPPEEAFSSESLLCVLTAAAAATIPCSSRLPGRTHLRAYRHHCLKRPSIQMQSITTLRPPGNIFITPCDRNGHERLILRWTRVFIDNNNDRAYILEERSGVYL